MLQHFRIICELQYLTIKFFSLKEIVSKIYIIFYIRDSRETVIATFRMIIINNYYMLFQRAIDWEYHSSILPPSVCNYKLQINVLNVINPFRAEYKRIAH